MSDKKPNVLLDALERIAGDWDISWGWENAEDVFTEIQEVASTAIREFHKEQP